MHALVENRGFERTVAGGLKQTLQREPVMAREHQGSEPWRVGVLWSQTGVTAVIEESQLKGTLLAIGEVNEAGGINGRELVPVIYDPASEPTNFARLADKLLTEDDVTTIFGCYTSSSRKAVLPVVERRNGLLWYPTLYEGFEYSPNVIYTGAAPNQNSIKLAEYMMELYGTRFFFVGSNYIYPWESNRIMRELLDARGGTVVAERYLDLLAGPEEFRPVMRDIQQTQPDVIFSTVVGQATAHLYQCYADAGLDPKVIPIASLTTTEAEVGLMGADVGEGHITAASYFEGVDTEANNIFVSNYKKRSATASPPTCVWRPRISRSTSSPRPWRRPTRWTRTSSGRWCWAASSTLRRAASASTTQTATPICGPGSVR